MGLDGQDVINSQINDDYDIFIGVMWSKIGSITERAESGTIEEFERALEKWKTNADAVNLGFYFKTDPIPQEILDPEQYQKCQNFKKRVQDEGCLTKNFSGEDFEKLIRRELIASIADFLTKLRKKKKNLAQVGQVRPQHD
jgi:hypothetical protein